MGNNKKKNLSSDSSAYIAGCHASLKKKKTRRSSQALVRLYAGSMQAYCIEPECSGKALCRLYAGVRLYAGSMQAYCIEPECYVSGA